MLGGYRHGHGPFGDKVAICSRVRDTGKQVWEGGDGILFCCDFVNPLDK